ncbi:hypothetical protein ACFQPA_06890 [Halomarina halobia]|uniref:Uncharacterized protein n=1 Tax=Halomarina halobia TaxID=3033386 RepID=A0ABD6A737_9EURY|nr:hypothetical protein [Halomarina sp. PSR21]
MTSKRDLEKRLDTLEPSHPDEERIFVAVIGGDDDAPTGWLSPAEYERHYGDLPESDFEYTIKWGGRESASHD